MMNMKKTGKIALKMLKAVGKGIGEGLDKATDILAEQKRRDAELKGSGSEKRESILLTADMLDRMKWLGEGQLRAIFAGKKVVIDSDPKVFDKMKWLGEGQLRAIFGDDIPKEEW